jgi:hypothetical protein
LKPVLYSLLFAFLLAFLMLAEPSHSPNPALASHNCTSPGTEGNGPNCGPDSMLIDMQEDPVGADSFANGRRVNGEIGTVEGGGGEGDQNASGCLDDGNPSNGAGLGEDDDGDTYVDEGCPRLTSRQDCVQIWEDGVANADEDAVLSNPGATASVDRAEIDVTVENIPSTDPILGFSFFLNYSEAGDPTSDGLPASLRVHGGSALASDARYLMFANPGSGDFGSQELDESNQGPVANPVDGTWEAFDLDTSLSAVEDGDGVLKRIRIESMAGGTPGVYQLWLTDAMVLDEHNDAQNPDQTTSYTANKAFVAISYDGPDADSVVTDGTAEEVNCPVPYPGEIHGTKWDDLDGNGVRNSEPGLSGVPICIYILTPPDTAGSQLSCTASSGSGEYEFLNLAPGFYKIEETAPAGRSQTHPANGQPHFVEVQAASITGIDFGNAPVPPGAIQGNKYNDANGNGVKDMGEAGVSGITICLHPMGECTATVSNGDYSFPSVPAGNHTVYEYLAPGSVNTTPLSVGVTVTSGSTVTGVDFGNRVPTPPPPEVTVQSTWDVAGTPGAFQGAPITKDVAAHCGAASPVQVKLVITSSYGGGATQQMMTNTSGEIWSAPVSTSAGGLQALTFYVDCPPDTAGFPEDIGAIAGEDEVQQGGNVYVVPSGEILDACNSNAPLSGVTVTLLRESPPTTDNFLPPASADHIPSTNPQTSVSDGAYGWVVVPGTYKVRAEKIGYITQESAAVSIPPAVTDLDIALVCDTDLDSIGDPSDNCPSISNTTQTNSDGDSFGNACDNCPTVTNGGQENLDADALGDACDADDDNDLVADIAETACGSDPLDVTPPLSRPERLDGAFASVDDDGDTQVDEGLPGGAAGFDCDGDGWTGTQEGSIYTSGGRDQDACGNNGWPAELNSGVASENKVTLSDIGSFFAPVVYFNTSVGTNPGDQRWDLIPNGMVQLQDVGSLLAGATAAPPMLGGVAAFNGPVCPWAP